jgi:hypothetical protein
MTLESAIESVFQVADESDRATLIETARNDDALERIRARVQPETHPDFDGVHCVECDDALPAARLALGRVRCVVCQSAIERDAKLHGK